MKNLILLVIVIPVLQLSVFAQEDFYYFEDYISTSWKSTNIDYPNWYEVNFNDNNWGYAVPYPGRFPPWCWSTHPDSSWQYSHCYFRTMIHTGQWSIQHATKVLIKLYADDDYELYVNGILVGTDYSGVAGPIGVYDVSSLWVDEENVIAIKAINTILGGSISGVVRYYFDESVNVSQDHSTIINKYELKQNYPNPFNPATTIEYEIQESGDVEINVYDELGQIVRNLFNAYQSKGVYNIMWDGKNNNGDAVSSGRYFYQIIKNDFIQTKKMVLMK